jgi:hypothetical protein
MSIGVAKKTTASGMLRPESSPARLHAIFTLRTRAALVEIFLIEVSRWLAGLGTMSG